MPADFTTRKLEIYYNFELANSVHDIKLRWLNPQDGANVNVTNAIFYAKRIAMSQGAGASAQPQVINPR